MKITVTSQPPSFQVAASCRGCRSGPENQDLFPRDVFPDDR